MWLLVIVEAAEGPRCHFECVNCDEGQLEVQGRRLDEDTGLLEFQVDR